MLHEVTYTLYTERPFFAEIYYRDTDPPDFAQYSHDPYRFSPNVEADLGPDRPWVLTVRLADPQQWAMVLGTSGLSPNPPDFHCSLAVDGAVVATNSAQRCALLPQTLVNQASPRTQTTALPCAAQARNNPSGACAT